MMTTLNDVLNAQSKAIDFLETDHEIIRSFEWVVDDDTPLPVDPTDYAQLKTALAWAISEQRRYTSALSDYRFEQFVDQLEDDYDAFEDEGLLGFEQYDAVALVAFRDACQRRMVAMEQADRKRLVEWNAGVPIQA